MSSKRPATLGGEPTSVTDASGSPGIVARRLQYLLETVRKPDGSRFTYREVLAGIEAQAARPCRSAISRSWSPAREATR